MHELGIMTGVMESVESVAREAGAERVLKVSLQVGVMTEAIEDASSHSRLWQRITIISKVPRLRWR